MREILEEAVRDQHADWRQECAEVQVCFEGWSLAPEQEREQAFARYLAALEDEERASQIYRDLIIEAGAHRAEGKPISRGRICGLVLNLPRRLLPHGRLGRPVLMFRAEGI
jgi:hypothetical protein